MRIGFTGTQRGMTPAQLVSVREFLANVEATEFHHGDCIGSDIQAAAIAADLRICTFIHPPLDEHKRGRYRSTLVENFICAPLPYMDRNHAIVHDTDVLLATPKTAEEEQRSGTWSTVRYAAKRNKTVVIINPNGEVATTWPTLQRISS